ncbi:hypothetical protein LBMAG46_30970 [Planctomycetia bacterium]|jgi:hypothetical protein|nr:hypothetical protein LBMAG46_30970 [Planctomycetia bacterium]
MAPGIEERTAANFEVDLQDSGITGKQFDLCHGTFVLQIFFAANGGEQCRRVVADELLPCGGKGVSAEFFQLAAYFSSHVQW